MTSDLFRLNSNLNEVRFSPSAQSLEMIRGSKKMLVELQKEIPQVAGMSFFGSRLTGTERQDSDLDIAIFYDSTTHQSDDSISQEMNGELEEKIRWSVFEKLKALGIPVDHPPLVFDICQKSTDRALLKFVDNVDEKIEDASFVGSELLRRFNIGSGIKLYKNRKYILDTLKKMPNGEMVFKKLMDCLVYTERSFGKPMGLESSDIQKYPQTIDDAYNYFLVAS